MFLFGRRPAIVLLFIAALSLPAVGGAQTFAVGPRLSFVHSDTAPSSPATRLVGGTMRLRSSRHVVLEAALDYRADYSVDRTSRVRQSPLQASLLLFPVRARVSPYLLAGVGLYTEHTDSLSPTGVVLESAMTRRTGSHLGIGAELFLARHAALFVDYRFRFVKFGASASDGEPINIPGLRSLNLSHRGTMWTSGLAFYF